jgi:hypothetical protein
VLAGPQRMHAEEGAMNTDSSPGIALKTGCASQGISHCVRSRISPICTCRPRAVPPRSPERTGRSIPVLLLTGGAKREGPRAPTRCYHPLECGIERRACRVLHQLDRAPVRKSRAEALSRHSRLDPPEMAQDAGRKVPPAFVFPATRPSRFAPASTSSTASMCPAISLFRINS